MGPLGFIPILKRIRWGGRRLGELLGKSIGPFSDYAESWEICDRATDQSIVECGPYREWPLTKLVRESAVELLGRHAGLSQFPLLVKFLDAHDRLSVQVHPNDDQARRCGLSDRGKTEAWVILGTEPGSCLYAGLKSGVDIAALRQAIENGTVEQCLHRIEVTAGDCLFIPAGTVHAIGEGILLAEIQQSSDVTFRLFDWNRVGADGNPRPVHVEQSLECIDFQRGPVNKVTPVRVPGVDHHLEELVTCPFFTIRRHLLSRSQSAMVLGDNRCHILMVLAGSLFFDGSEAVQPLKMGQTLLLPASALPVKLEPRTTSTVLEVFWS